MRELSKTEQDVIKRLIEWEEILEKEPHNFFQIDLGILFNDIGGKYNSYCKIDFDNTEISLKSTSEKTLTGLSENNSFRRDFITLVYFIDYLNTERVIYLVPTDPDIYTPILEFSHLLQNRTPFVSKIDDIEFIELLKTLFFKHIYPTEYLTKYYKQKCRSDEELRFEKSINVGKKGVDYAKYSIWVAIAIGITSIVLTAVTLTKPDRGLEKINNRIDNIDTKLIRRIDKLDSRFDKLEIQLNKLNVDVFVENKHIRNSEIKLQKPLR